MPSLEFQAILRDGWLTEHRGDRYCIAMVLPEEEGAPATRTVDGRGEARGAGGKSEGRV